MSDITRHNMIEQQLRTWEVLDSDVLSLYADDTLRRDNFIAAPEKKALAYADMALPIEEGQCMLEPKLEARLLQSLAPQRREKILHIGSGSGFFAALLGRLAAQVISVEIRPQLAETAAARLAPVSPAVTVVTGDGARGWPAQAPYNAIVFTAALPHLPAELSAQLAAGGRVLAVIGSAPAMTLQLFVKDSNGVLYCRQSILETVIPPLDNAAAAAAFSF